MCARVASYDKLNDVVDHFFPPLLGSEEGRIVSGNFPAPDEFSTFTYWRTPLPTVSADEVAAMLQAAGSDATASTTTTDKKWEDELSTFTYWRTPLPTVSADEVVAMLQAAGSDAAAAADKKWCDMTPPTRSDMTSDKTSDKKRRAWLDTADVVEGLAEEGMRTEHDAMGRKWRDGQEVTWRTRSDVTDKKWRGGQEVTWRTRSDVTDKKWRDGQEVTWRTRSDAADKKWRDGQEVTRRTGSDAADGAIVGVIGQGRSIEVKRKVTTRLVGDGKDVGVSVSCKLWDEKMRCVGESGREENVVEGTRTDSVPRTSGQIIVSRGHA